MGELGANFCRNDFLKSKLNEMDFSSGVSDPMSGRTQERDVHYDQIPLKKCYCRQ